MAVEIGYVVITPHTIRKSRTGAVLSRLLGRVSAELVAARIFSPTAELAAAYAAQVRPGLSPENDRYRGLIRDYIRRSLTPETDGRRHRALMLVFKGENVLAELGQVVGHLSISSATGETIRDTFGDMVINPDGSVGYFEPAVLLGETAAEVAAELRVWVDFARTQPALLTNVCTYACPEKVQQTLVIIKPDSWRQMSSRPGAIIDMFSRTGLRIIGLKICQISVAQALEFYGPVKDVLCRKLAPGVGSKAREILQEALNCQLPAEIEADLAQKVGIPVAVDQFERIIEFMSGVRPSACPTTDWEKPGRVKCMALVYEGEDAVQKIRDVLGPTDPNKAPSGTVRREFGHDVMVNTAHASDSPENAKREMGILRFSENDFVPVLEKALEG